MIERTFRVSRVPHGALPGALLTLLGITAAPPPAVAGSTISVAEYPLSVAVPAHPQVLLAVANSQSMDGDTTNPAIPNNSTYNTGGAIMTGSGALGASLSALQSTDSLLNYTVPPNFTAPVTNTTSGSTAAYTVTTGGVQYDNSASRLNVAKAGVTSILNNFLAVADFGLIDYQTSGNGAYTTWVYYMSPTGGFTFTNTPAAGNLYTANPCYGIALDTANGVDSSCKSINGLGGRFSNIATYKWMAIGDSSDEPQISDVLYAGGGFSPIFLQQGGATGTPYSVYNLSQYNSNQVQWCYSSTTPSVGGICETPTNAGFVPYTPEVMNVQRGFGFYTTQETSTPGTSTTTWPVLVPMQTAGQSPTQTSINSAASHFTAQLAPETNSVSTGEIKAQATQSPIAGLLLASQNYFSTNPVSSNGCPPNKYVVLVTDGLPTMDLAGHSWPPLGSSAATGYGVTATFNADGSLNTTNSQALTDTINTLQALKAAKIKTYIIALGAGIASPTGVIGQTLTSMAVAGGSNTFYSALDAQGMQSAMQSILAHILAETASTSAASVNSTGINTKSVAYEGKFTTSDTYQDWTGDLLAFPINPTTGVINTTSSAALWSAQTQLDAQSWDTGRQIATWDPVAHGGTAFRWNTSTTATSGIASSTTLGQALQTFTADTSGSDVLQFLRGNSAKEVRNGGAFRNRTHKLGDIVDSAPLYVGGPSGPWQQGSYFTFESTYRNREPLIYVGANDGMLHAFDAATGNEKFAFIPNGVWNDLTKLANPYYNEQHWFYVDGSPSAADVQFSGDGSWHTLLFGGEAGGGKTIYALDVSNPSLWTSEAAVASSVQWEFSDTNMGLSYSSPVAAYTSGGFAIMFGNGYNSTINAPVLYAVNPQTGAAITPAGGMNLCLQVPTACNASAPNGLSSVAVVNTSGLASSPANVVYAGDLQGNLWRINISNNNPSLWTATVLFQARDSSGNAQPITVTPAVTLNPLAPTLTGMMVYFGTGQLLSVSDLASTQVQTFYGVFDNMSGSSTPLLRASLQQQTMTALTQTNPTTGASVSLRELSATPVLLPSKKGWFVDLSLLPGERDVTSPILFNGTVQVTTYQPNSSPCTSGGQSYYMVFNYVTGGATTQPQFDWMGGTSVGSGDLVAGNVISGVSLGTSYSAAPKVITGMGGARAYTTSGCSETNGNCGSSSGGSSSGGSSSGGSSSGGSSSGSSIPGWQNADSNAHGAWTEVR